MSAEEIKRVETLCAAAKASPSHAKTHANDGGHTSTSGQPHTAPAADLPAAAAKLKELGNVSYVCGGEFAPMHLSRVLDDSELGSYPTMHIPIHTHTYMHAHFKTEYRVLNLLSRDPPPLLQV